MSVIWYKLHSTTSIRIFKTKTIVYYHLRKRQCLREARLKAAWLNGLGSWIT